MRPAIKIAWDSTTIVARNDVLIGEFGREVVLLNLRDGVYYSLEEVGARIWQLLQTPVMMASVCDAIVSEYDVTRAQCERDVRALLGALASHALIEVQSR
jgi:Coenzyme PQQ synthesis protein D (PqqD)